MGANAAGSVVVNDGKALTEKKKVKFISNFLVYEFQVETAPSKDYTDKDQKDNITLKTDDGSYTHKINVGSKVVSKTKVGGWVKLSFPLSKGVTKDSKLTMVHDRGDKEQQLVIFENVAYADLISN